MKTHAIVTYSGVHYLITDEQYEKLKSLKLDGSITLDGNFIKARNIADVLTMEKYYETYPEKRPQYIDRYKNLPGLGFEGLIKNSRTKSLNGMIKGLKGYIASKKYMGTEPPTELLSLMESRLKDCELSTANIT